MKDDDLRKSLLAIKDAAMATERLRMKPFDGLRSELRAIEGLDKIRLKSSLSMPRQVRIPPNPVLRTNAEIEKLNEQMETLLGGATGRLLPPSGAPGPL
jgi:hypothetical protein